MNKKPEPVSHPLAWRVVQEFGHVLNLLSVNERLPTVFKLVSPAPHLNGGVEFLSWVIATDDDDEADQLPPAVFGITPRVTLPQPKNLPPFSPSC